jgi:hypothetical protein
MPVIYSFCQLACLSSNDIPFSYHHYPLSQLVLHALIYLSYQTYELTSE